MKILKFGGSSLGTTNCIRGVARIVLEEAGRGPVIVVLSAFQGVTNQLLDCARLAEKNDRRYDAAWKKIAVLRYVGTLEGGHAHAGIREFPHDHPIAATKGSDNIIAFTTKRYSRTPLVVQGPGAGADVTAMGVFSDILKLLNYLPH